MNGNNFTMDEQGRGSLLLSKETLLLLVIAAAAFLAVFSSGSFHGVADAIRYFASGESLVTQGHGFNTGVSYDKLAVARFNLDKTMQYPSQLYQVYLGTLTHLFGFAPQISMLALANLPPYIGSLLLMHAILRRELGTAWAATAVAFVALVSPSFTELMLRNATEPWMVFFGLWALRQLLKGHDLRAGSLVAVTFFFRAQIISTLLGFILLRRKAKSLIAFALGLGLTFASIRIVLHLAFPATQESTSGFYIRAFFYKYEFSFAKGIEIVKGNWDDFNVLFAMLLTCTLMLMVRSRLPVSEYARKLITFFSANAWVMAIFAFYMACTVGDGIQDRYFVLLLSLFWLCLFLIINAIIRSHFQAQASTTQHAPLFISLALLAFSVTHVDLASFKRNLYAEDIPAGFFRQVSRQNVVLVSEGSALISMHADPLYIAFIPPYDKFYTSAFNTRVDYIFLHTAKERIPVDWKPVWNQTQFSDRAGVRFALVSSFDSPRRTSRLFKRADSASP